jgi:hypothetical protein
MSSLKVSQLYFHQIFPMRATFPAHPIIFIFMSLMRLNTPLTTFCLSLSLYGSTALRPWSPFQFFNPTHSRYDSLDGGSASSKTAIYTRTTQTQNKRIQTPMPRLWFEPTIPVFEWAKTAPSALNFINPFSALDISLYRCLLLVAISTIFHNYWHFRMQTE